ncbi:MAG: YceI family protein [Schleiferiaceae bacterium]|jgi:polyisoprenoid-binding protein YceI|nr:YceI family protein [Schleiferiaceae bacterium]
MKKLALMAALGLFVASCNSDKAAEATTGEAQEVTANGAAETIALDSGSTVAWRGFKTYTPMDDQHLGTVNVQEGTFDVAEGKLVGGSITIDMNSITCTDLEDEGKRGYLEGHLKSDAFFHADSFPTAVFEIVEVVDPSEATKYSTVTGNLTIRGTTNSITFPADVSVVEDGVKFMAPTFSIDRTLWGANFHNRDDATIAESLKDDLIDHSIELTIKVKATK